MLGWVGGRGREEKGVVVVGCFFGGFFCWEGGKEGRREGGGLDVLGWR